MSEVKSIFQQRFEAAQQLKKEKEANKSSGSTYSSYDFEELHFLGLKTEEEVIFRPVGEPFDPMNPENRINDYDAKLVLHSEIVNEDNTKYVKVNWKYVVKDATYKPDPNWILTRLYDKVNEGGWVKYKDDDVDGKEVIVQDGKVINVKTGKNGYWNKKHKNTQIFQRVMDENRRVNDKYPPSFYPSKRVLMNVISRMDDFSLSKKEAMLLTSKKEPYTFKNDQGETQTIYFTDTGIPFSLYEMILEHANKSVGHWDIDFVVTKKPKTQSKYEVWDASDTKYLGEAGKTLSKVDVLSDDEMNYKKVNLNKMWNPTSYRKLQKDLGFLFRLCDNELGTQLYSDLQKLVEIEQEEADKKKEEASEVKEEIKETPKPVEVKPVAEVKETPKPVETKEVKTEPPVRRQSASSVANGVEADCVKYFPKWDMLSVEEKEHMVNSIIRFDKNVPMYRSESVPMLCGNVECTYDGDKETEFPQAVMTCPICGTKVQ